MKKVLLVIALAFTMLEPFAQKKGKDYITRMSNGKIYWMRGAQTIRMMIDVPLKNGSVVNNKGNIKTKDGQSIYLKQGDKVMMDGTVVRSKK